MKRCLFLFAVVVLFSTTNLFSQLSLEVVWEKPQAGVIDAKFSPDGKYVYCAIGADIKKLDVATGEFVATFDKGEFDNTYTYLDISPDGEWLLTGGYDGFVNLWNTEQQRIVKGIKIPEQQDNQSLYYSSFSPDNKTIIINLATKQPHPQFPTNEMVLYDFIDDKVINKVPFERIGHVQFSKDGRYFITGTKYEKIPKVTLWDANTLKPIRDYEVPEGNDDGFTKIQLSENNKLIGINVFSPNIFVNIIETETGKVVATNKLGTAGGNFVLLQDDYFIIYEVASFEDYGLSIYKYPNIFQSKINKGGGDVLVSFENHKEIDDKLYVFQAHPTEMKLYKKSTTGVNEPTKPEFNIKVEPEKITVNFENAESIKIIDIKGKILFDKKINEPSITIPNTFITGTYICVVKSGNKEFSQKFQVMR